MLDTAKAAMFARLSEAAYLDEARASAACARDGWVLIAWIDAGSTEGFVAARQTGCEAAVVFRGTSERADVFTDLRADKVPALPWWTCGRVHAGFAMAAAAAWPTVKDALSTIRKARGAAAVWFVGHSLGGALATLTAGRVRAERRAFISGVVTFGCPRVGDGDFAVDLGVEFHGLISRYVNNSDIVPRLLWLTYAHVAAMLYLTRKGALVRAPGLLFVLWDMLLGRLSGRLLNPLCWKTDGLRDHSIRAYRAALEALEVRGS